MAHLGTTRADFMLEVCHAHLHLANLDGDGPRVGVDGEELQPHRVRQVEAVSRARRAPVSGADGVKEIVHLQKRAPRRQADAVRLDERLAVVTCCALLGDAAKQVRAAR